MSLIIKAVGAVTGLIFAFGLFGLYQMVLTSPEMWGKFATIWLLQIAPLGVSLILTIVITKHMLQQAQIWR